MGGVVYPLVLQALIPKLGFGWATRVIGFINVFLLTLANLFIRSRLPPKKATKESILPDFKIFRDPAFLLCTIGTFFLEYGLFVPITYLISFTLHSGATNDTFAYQIIAIFNAGSSFGRWLPGYAADAIGRYNTMILTVALCMS